MATRRVPYVPPNLPVVSGETMSFEEFLVAFDGVHAEWVDGKVHVMSPGNAQQSRLGLFLSSIIQYWAEEHDLGEVYVPPFTVRTRPGAGREPDVFFVRREHLGRVHETYVEAPVDLVIEISGAESRGRDRGEKFYEYEEAGIPEYWRIDPERSTVEAYRLGEGGTYEETPPGDPPVLRSEVLPGLWIPVEWLWQMPLPKQTWVHRQWGRA
jgi:Uma2 family endonuclease